MVAKQNIDRKYITVNVAFGGSKVRTEKMGGVQYLVAPVSMLVPGVLNGSMGALYYPREEVVKNAQAWNFMPLTLGHPTSENGRPVGARSPDIIEKFGLGFVFNVSTDKGKLDGEAWFDINRTGAIAPDILNRLQKGNPIELSTGLFTDKRYVRNRNFKGKPYEAIATNYRPDHLAVLPDTRGACSLEDGCGVLVNEEKEKSPCMVVNTIRKVGNKYVIFSKKGKRLGEYDSEAAAKKRLKQIEYFKHANNQECTCSYRHAVYEFYLREPTNNECDGNCPDCDCEECTSNRRKRIMNKCAVHNQTRKPCPVTNAGTGGCGAGSPGGKGFAKGNTCGALGGTGHAGSVGSELDRAMAMFERAKKKKPTEDDNSDEGEDISKAMTQDEFDKKVKDIEKRNAKKGPPTLD
jgi:hypothetical protein